MDARAGLRIVLSAVNGNKLASKLMSGYDHVCLTIGNSALCNSLYKSIIGVRAKNLQMGLQWRAFRSWFLLP